MRALSQLREDYTGYRLLAIHAHPDDESSKGAAMMADYADRGADVMVLSCTGGERGDVLNAEAASNPRTEWDLTGVRWQEMAEATEILGIHHRWLGFVDSGLPEGDPLPALPAGSFATLPLEQVAAPIVKLVRDFKPHVIISYDEIGGYPHPDHIQSHKVSVEAFTKAGDPNAYPDAGEPWEPLKLYYDRAFNPDKFLTLHEYLLESTGESPYTSRIARYEEGIRTKADWMTHHKVTTQVNSAHLLDRRDAALRAHRTQVEPYGFFFMVNNDILTEKWPWEDYVLIDSKVDTELPETCLFAGITPAATL
ncbi:mycothiol conjugate amidase Mca [Micrococcoides hystricis]|uniref:Mycothiol S-conjugate amidase n=1 Tax=Micrococcoides hystricis TaxID=1572761 RepID=A0ABV6PCB9_9MICC